jgi:Tol biopolymer transport system component
VHLGVRPLFVLIEFLPPLVAFEMVASPDGRWIAYTSGDSGRPEIQVQDFVGGSGAAPWTQGYLTIASPGGGTFPRWSRDGKELFYMTPDGDLMTVPVKTTGRFSAGKPEKLFPLPGGRFVYRRPYAVSAEM